jgi:hypothetical protein
VRRPPHSPDPTGDRRVGHALRGALAAGLATLALAACGSSSTDTAATSAPAKARPSKTGASSRSASAPPPAPGGCAAAVAATLGGVGQRIYHAASTGSNVEQAVHRVRRSAALGSAISAGDAGAARTALRELLANQIVRIEILQHGHVFAGAGSGAAIAPVRGPIPGTGASFVLSVQADRSYLQVARQVTGAQILLLSDSTSGASAARRLDGTIEGPPPARIPTSGTLDYQEKKYELFSLAGSVFPSGRMRIALLVPSSAIRCPGSAAQTVLETLGHVGERIYQEERQSSYVLATLRHIEADTGFQRAVATRDVAATRAAIVGFFAAHIHVVRVRVNVSEPSGAQRLFYDLGGPYVLAPVHGTLRSGGRVVGHFTMAIQDDAGYLRLAHLFTGAEVLMRAGSRQLMGTLDPGPAKVPDRGEVSYRGRAYQAYSFTGEAFPSGPLRISLLLAS